MSSHQVAVAKAALSGALLRADTTSIPRDDINNFHSMLNNTILQCSRQNVQNCKSWIVNNCLSSGRVIALGKYLTALVNSFSETSLGQKKEPSWKRKRLHILYLLNDVLSHCQRMHDLSTAGKLQAFLMELFGHAASPQQAPKHHEKIRQLLDIWEDENYYSKEYIDKLREAAVNSIEAGGVANRIKNSTIPGDTSVGAKSAPFVMPRMHGDQNTPWYDLPAGNLLPHIIPNSTRALNPTMIRPLQFVAGPAEERLVEAVKDLLKDVDRIFDGIDYQDQDMQLDIDELGQTIIQDDTADEGTKGDGYYGWSKAFCEKMQQRRKGVDAPRGKRREDSQSLSRSSSRSSSRGAKRKRYSNSPDDQRRRTRHDSESSRSRTPSNDRLRFRRREASDLRSRSPSRSRSPPAGFDTRSPSYSPSSALPGDNKAQTQSQPPPPPNSFGAMPPKYGLVTPPPPPPPQFLAQMGLPFNPGNLPIPPPPPNYNGPWPPPPPSIAGMSNLPHGQSFPQGIQYGAMPWASQPPSFPPPPPPSHVGGGNNYQGPGDLPPRYGAGAVQGGAWNEHGVYNQFQGRGGYRGGKGNGRGRGW